jgi:beta-lactamase regulating signal transducer with metallopeptidase domain/thiol-disulfide isomerase/thioredoxin
MSPLRTLLDSAVVNRLGWTLVHFLWEGLAVAVVLGLVLALLRKRSAGTRYLVALGGMVALAALPAVTFLLVPPPKQAAGPTPPGGNAKSVAKLLPLASGKGSDTAASRMVVLPPPPTSLSGPTAPTVRRGSATPQAAAAEPARPWRERLGESVRAGVEWFSPVLPWLVVGWGLGAVLCSVWNLGGWVAVRRLRVRAVLAVAGDVERVVARLAGRMGVWRAVRVLQSAVIDSPIVIGALKPVILVPVGILTGLSPRELESILAHELAHVRRHDYLVNLMQGVIETLLFYHPAVWWISRRVRVEREHCCDDEAVRATGDRAVYVGALAAVAESAGGALGGPRLAPAATGGVLLARVRRVLGLPDADAGRAPRWLAGLVALVLCVVATGTVVTRAQEKPPKDPFADAPKLAAIEFEVVDPRNSQPMPDVELSVRETGGPRVFATDDAGKAHIEYKPNAKYLQITAKKEGFVPTSVTWRNDGGAKDPIPGEYMLKLEPATTIGGIVTDEAGKPIEGVDVSLIIDRKGDTYATRERAGIYDKVFKTNKEGKWVCDQAPQEFNDPWIKLSHPDYVSDEMYGTTPKPPLAKLRDMTGVMVMKKGVELIGRVVDKDGKPIKGADVAQGRDRFGSSYPSVKTAVDGTFKFPQTRPGNEVVLTIKSKGMAPELKSFVLPPQGMKDLEIKLEPGHTLKGRVVDEKGNPVPKVMLAVDTWRGNRSLMHRQNTDDQGRFEWKEAPADEMQIDFLKQGYMDMRRHKLVASDQEVTVTLLPVLKVTGTVVDDATGQPVPAFRVIQGTDWGQGQAIYWDLRGQRIDGRDGKFQLDVSYPQPGHAVRIDAEGYAPAPSRVFKSDEKSVALEFRLKKAEMIVGTLKMPDGKPVVGAEVVICAGQNGAYIRNGAIDRSGEALTVKSDANGQFRILPQLGKYALAVLHAGGYAEVMGSEFEKTRQIMVQPWGRIEGTARVGSKAKAGEALNVSRQDPVFMQSDSPRIYHDIQTTTDDQGRFVFERVPAGPATVAMQVKLSPNMTGYSQSTFVEVKAGETVRVELGGKGRPVVGKVSIPEALKGKVNWAMSNTSMAPQVNFPQPKLPDDWAKMTNEARQTFYDAWRKTPEGQAAEKMQREMKWYAVRIEGDNTFRVDDVLAGKYQLSVSVQDPNSENRWGGEMIAQGGLNFVVPEMPGGRSDEVLDVGTLELKPMVRLKVGDRAPALKVKTLDGKDLSLEEFKGKHVIVDFWATWCGPCVQELPKLKEAYAAYAKDERVVFISLSLDQNTETAKLFVEKNDMPWRQGFLGEWSKTTVPGEWGVQGIPACFLLGPDGKIVAKNLSGDSVKAALAAALPAK